MRLCWLGLCARLPQCVLEPWHCCRELKCQHAASAGAHHARAVPHARGDPGRGGHRSLRRMVLPISPDGDKLLAWILRSILAADFQRIVSAQLAGLDARRRSRLQENGSCGARGSLANRPGSRQRLAQPRFSPRRIDGRALSKPRLPPLFFRLAQQSREPGCIATALDVMFPG